MTEPLLALSQSAYLMAYQLLGKREDAMDVLQEAAAIALSHNRAPGRQTNDFKPWFFKVVRNKALDQLRKQQRFVHESVELHHILDETTINPERCLENLQLKSKIESALMKLSMEQREILLLKDFHDFSYAQIAEILAIPKGSVMSRLHRARMVLRKILGDINQ